MRRALVGIASVILLLPSGAPASARSHKRCATRGTTVTANAQVRVYRTGQLDDRTFTGCVLKTGKSTYLGYEGGGGEHSYALFFRLAGPRVAFVNEYCVGGCSYQARTIDLRTRKGSRWTGWHDGYPLDLRIASSGSFALLIAFDGPEEAVAKVEADGMHQLDYGPGMDEHSLAIGGSHVYWTRAGEVHSAAIR